MFYLLLIMNIVKYLFLIILLTFTSCSSNDEDSPVPKVKENTVFRFIKKNNETSKNVYEVAEFCLRVYYPNEDYTRFMNKYSYQNEFLDTLDFVVPLLYAGCIYEYRIYLSNHSWNAEKIHKNYLFKEIKLVSACDSIKLVFPEDTIYSIKIAE